MSPLLRGVLAAGILGVMSLPALADPEGAAAILMIEDEQGGHRTQLTERLGAQLYQRFLYAGPYRSVRTLTGRDDANARLAATIRELAADHDVIDLFLSVHTTDRHPKELLQAIPPEARKLRLVYSTACHGAHHERKAWETVGASAIVTHDGINNPLLALPYFLSRWLRGVSASQAVSGGYLLTQRMMSFALSLPGMGAIDLPDVSGSRPVYVGDRGVSFLTGLDTSTRNRVRRGFGRGYGGLPPGLRYSSRTGGPLGLALRALAYRGFSVGPHEIDAMLRDVVLPSALPQDVLAQVESVDVVSPALGKVKLRLRREVELEQQGVTLVFGRTVHLWAGQMHMANRELDVNISGLWARKGLLRARINNLSLRPSDDPDDGYAVTARIAIYGFIPWWHTLELGGERAAPVENDGPIYHPMPARPPEPQGDGIKQVVESLTRN